MIRIEVTTDSDDHFLKQLIEDITEAFDKIDQYRNSCG